MGLKDWLNDLRERFSPQQEQPQRTPEQAMVIHAQADMAQDSRMWVEPSEPFHKIGSEHLDAMLRLGAHELTQALAAFPDSNIRPMEEPGVFGNASLPHIVDRDEGMDR